MQWKHQRNTKKKEEFVPVTVVTKKEAFQIPFLQDNFVGFKEALAFKESQGKYRAVKYLRIFRKISIWKNNSRAF